MKLSICIPTYNRAQHLTNCLQSIADNVSAIPGEFEICISDNASSDHTERVVADAARKLPITYSRNSENLGIPRNFLKVVDLARGEFAWLLGDDDLLMRDAISRICALIEKERNVDYFYVNAFHLSTEYILSFPQPFQTSDLPEDLRPFSPRTQDGEMAFLDLIDPKISFDFLGGMFLAVFRRTKWEDSKSVLDHDAIHDPRTFSHFDNTFPHVKIFANAFARSHAYFHAEPLSVCLTGAREWSPMYPLVHSVRLVEALDEYRKNGLPYPQFWRCKNYALNNFIPDMGAMILHRERSGFRYVNPAMLTLKACLFPNFYLSPISFAGRRLKRAWDRVFANRPEQKSGAA